MLWLPSRSRLVILRASRLDYQPEPLHGFSIVRLAGTLSAEQRETVEKAMAAAAEPRGLVAQRLAHGDQFFGWQIDDDVVSFGWVTYKDRIVGRIQFKDAVGRAFLFNFHTLAPYRGRGLYPALLEMMRFTLGKEAITEYIIDVNAHNVSSLKGIHKAGFSPVVQIDYWQLLKHWLWIEKSSQLNNTATSHLFSVNF